MGQSAGQEKEKICKAPYTMNRRAERIHQLRQELRALTRQYRCAVEDGKPPLAELCHMLRGKLMTLRRRSAAFIAHPFLFARELLGSKPLTCSKEEVDQFLYTILHNP